MKKSLAVVLGVFVASCTVQKSISTRSSDTCEPYAYSGQSTGTTSYVPISVGCGYVNQPCVAVKICVPGSTTECTTIDHILLDTGSYGLRLFSCTHSLNLPQQTGTFTKTGTTINGSKTVSSMSSVTTLIAGQTITGTGIPANTTIASVGATSITLSNAATASGAGVTLSITGDVAQCVHYADGSSDWGPVKLADVYLAGQKAASIPIQSVDSTYGTVPASCGSPEVSPQTTGFNGILGVGLLTYDCPACNSGSRTAGYYSCSSSGCTGYAAPNAVQTANPVAMLGASYNNGVVLSMQDVGSDYGATGITGNMILGIDTIAGVPTPGVATTSNMSTSVANTYTANANLFFNTTFPASASDGTQHVFPNSFVDSGSNLWDFADDYLSSQITMCSDGFFCPTTPRTLSATPAGGSAHTFKLINADTANYNNTAYKTLGAYFDVSNGSFDWGMPHYYGRNIYHLISGKTSGNMGTGPKWAW